MKNFPCLNCNGDTELVWVRRDGGTKLVACHACNLTSWYPQQMFEKSSTYYEKPHIVGPITDRDMLDIQGYRELRARRESL